MKFLFRMFAKITGAPCFYLFLRLKKYHLNPWQKVKLNKEGAIIIANHTSTADFFILLLAFWRKYVHMLIGEDFYRKKSWGTMLNLCGAIQVKRNLHDMSFMGECLKILEKGGYIGLFPEGRFNKGHNLNPFQPAVVYLALKSNKPIIPTYIENNAGTKKRSRIIIGQKIYVRDYIKTNNPSKEEIAEFLHLLEGKVNELKKQLRVYKSVPVYGYVNPHWWLLEIVRLIFIPLTYIVFPAKFHYLDGSTRKKDLNIKGGGLVLSNHRTFYDPPAIMIHFGYRRVHVIMAEDATFKFKWFFKGIGCIIYHRQHGASDPRCFMTAINYLRGHGVVALYPEGHLTRGKKMLPLEDGAAYFAISGNAPIYFYYMKYQHKPFKMNHIYIIPHLDPKDHFTKEELADKNTISKLTKMIEHKFSYLENYAFSDHSSDRKDMDKWYKPIEIKRPAESKKNQN